MKRKSKIQLALLGTGAVSLWCLLRNHRYPLNKEYRLLNKFWCPGRVLTPGTASLCNKMMPSSGFDPSSLQVETQSSFVPARDGYDIPVTIYRKKDAKKPANCLLYFHGGGFCLGKGPQYDRLMAEYAAHADCSVIFVDYRTSDHHPYPIPFHDCLDVFVSVIADPKKYGLHPDRLILGGDSAGGALAASASLWARDHQIPVCMQFLVYPVTDCRMQSDTDKKYWDSPMWNSSLSRKMWQIYLRNGVDEKVEYASPILADDFSDLAPAWIEVEEFDSLKDDGLEYARALRKAGTEAIVHENCDSIHGFDTFFSAELSRNAMKRRILALQNGFGK